MADKRKVLITGGSGYLAGMLCEGLSDRFDFSLVDAVSFELMSGRGIREALTLDRHFSAAGFVVIPGS